MSDNRVSLSIIGCCAIRDIFGLHEDDGGYDIKRYVQNVSPISAVSRSPLTRHLTDEDNYLFAGKGNFIARCQRLELEKKIFDYMEEDMADFLVMDAAEFRRKIIKFDGVERCFSENYNLKLLFDRYVEAGIVPKDFEICNPLNIYRNTLNEILQEYCNKLCDMYDPYRVILVEIKAGGHHEIDDERLCAAEDATAKIFNERISYAFDYIERYLECAHVIRFPEYVTIDRKHKWGRNLLHFVKEYYEYALEAVNVITSRKYAWEDEKKVLNELKKTCEATLYEKYFSGKEI